MILDSLKLFIEIIKNIKIEEIILYRIGNHRSFYKVINNEHEAQKSFNGLLDNFKLKTK